MIKTDRKHIFFQLWTYQKDRGDGNFEPSVTFKINNISMCGFIDEIYYENQTKQIVVVIKMCKERLWKIFCYWMYIFAMQQLRGGVTKVALSFVTGRERTNLIVINIV